MINLKLVFSIPRGTLPWHPTVVGFVRRSDFGHASGAAGRANFALHLVDNYYAWKPAATSTADRASNSMDGRGHQPHHHTERQYASSPGGGDGGVVDVWSHLASLPVPGRARRRRHVDVHRAGVDVL